VTSYIQLGIHLYAEQLVNIPIFNDFHTSQVFNFYSTSYVLQAVDILPVFGSSRDVEITLI